MAAVLLLCFLYLLLALSAFYFTGALILKPFGYKAKGCYSDLFDKCIAGLVVCVFLFSVFASSFRTIQWGLLIVAVFIWYELKVAKKKNLGITAQSAGKWSLKAFFPFLLVAVFVYAWFAFQVFNWAGDFIYAMPHKDKVYYSNIATALAEFGNENRQGAYLPGQTQSITEPYHYFDLWFAAMLSFLTLKPSIVVMSLLCLPLCTLIAMAGVLSVFERGGTLKVWHCLIAFLLLFVRGIYLKINDPDIAWAENFSESIVEFKSEKLGVIYIFAMLSFRLLLSGKMGAALASLLFLSVISIGNFPGVIGGVLIFILIALSIKELDRAGGLRILMYCAATAGFIYLFYHYTSDANSNAYLEKGLWVFTDMNEVTLRSVKIAAAELFVRVINNPWRAVLIHLPFLMVALLALRANKSMSHAFLVIGSVYLVSLAMYGFFYKLVDAPQFYTNNLPLLNVFLILAAAHFLSSMLYSMAAKKFVAVGLSGILLVMMVTAVMVYRDSRGFTELYSDRYLCQLDSVQKNMQERSKIAVMYDPLQKPDLYNCDMSGPNLYYQPYFAKFQVPVDINIFARREMPWGGEMGEVQKRFVEKAPFRQFVLQQMIAGAYKDIGESQVKYLEKENIRYIFVSKGFEPDHRLVAFVKNRIRDERSGEQLLILNSWH